jgi:ATPase subunit of ABC transporter with duplicated ATPase domains
LMALRPGLLLVDEPTNHVGFDVLRELERALNDFPGPVIVVSHDRWFIDHFKGDRWTIEHGLLSPVSVVQRTPDEEARLIDEIETLSQYPMS